MDAIAVFPVPPLVELTVTLLSWTPAVVPVTLTLNVQFELVARVAPDSETVPVPGVAVIVPPPQPPVKPLGVATVSPDGRVSVKLTPVSEIVFAAGLVTVKLKLVEPPTKIEDAPKDLLIEGAAITTCPPDSEPLLEVKFVSPL